MHGRERRIVAGLLLGVLLCSRAAAQAAASAPPALSASAVRAAIEAVRRDPLLSGRGSERVLRFKRDEPASAPKAEAANMQWWLDLMESLSAGLRVAVWLVAAGLLVWALLRLRDWLLARERAQAPHMAAPTHVGSLDIRPESLPDDVGAEARTLWQRGEARAALSLLYRGALSRLVHAHGVKIRAASTEGECLLLAGQRLSLEAQAFLELLVRSWQSVAYARRAPQTADMERLCAGFAVEFERSGGRP